MLISHLVWISLTCSYPVWRLQKYPQWYSPVHQTHSAHKIFAEWGKWVWCMRLNLIGTPCSCVYYYAWYYNMTAIYLNNNYNILLYIIHNLGIYCQQLKFTGKFQHCQPETARLYCCLCTIWCGNWCVVLYTLVEFWTCFQFTEVYMGHLGWISVYMAHAGVYWKWMHPCNR